MVQISGQPVAAQDAAAKARVGHGLSSVQKRDIRGRLQSVQQAIKPAIRAAGGTIVGQMQDAYNGIQVVIAQKKLTRLAALPNVVAVRRVQAFTPSNVNGVPFVGAPQVWGAPDGFTGQGVKVAIIDTGIDYTHADFGGLGTPAAYQYAHSNATVDPASDPQLAAEFGPNAPKVKGGWDFAGDSYRGPVSTPQPDPNPIDCNGHGTHTAGTLAGSGVTADGQTYTGPYDSTTVTAGDPNGKWLVGPGVAPQADIYEYKVFGCAGSTGLTALAINQAVMDGMNVISMSLGSPFGGTQDPTAVAAQTAVNDGVAVIAAAGNAGPSAYLVGSPSSASGVLSVAAMDATNPTYPGAHLAFSTGDTLDALLSNGCLRSTQSPCPTLSGNYPVKVLTNSNGGISLGCNKSEYAGTSGDVVVTMRGTCNRVNRAIFGQDAGAAAVVMLNNAPTIPPYEGPITTTDPSTNQPVTVTIPFLGLANDTTGAISSELLAADGGTVTLSPTTVPNTSFGLTASFSSAGPRSFDSAPKPDVIGPGVNVASAGIGSGTGAITESGTSMATPMAAGIAALVKQAHPSWDGLQIKAAIMNTADPSLNAGYDSQLAGTGVIQAPAAVASPVLAQTSDGLDAVAFGVVSRGRTAYSASKVLTLTNTGGSPSTYQLSVAPNGSQLGATVSVSPSSVTVPAGGSVSVHASLQIPTAAFAALPSDDTFTVGPGNVESVRGELVGTPSSGAGLPTLRVPYMIVPRGLSNVNTGAKPSFVAQGGTLTGSLALANAGIHTGTADLYAWGIHVPTSHGSSPSGVRDVGVQADPATDAQGNNLPNDRLLVFLINTQAAASTQASNEYDILIDTNGDGTPDYVVVSFDLGAVETGSFNGQTATFTINANTNQIIDARLTDAPMNGTTIEAPTLASDLGLSGTDVSHATFSYSVNSYLTMPTATVGSTPTARFNPFSPAVSSGNFTTLGPGATDSFPLTVNEQAQGQAPARGWLVASVDDPNGIPQANEVAVPPLPKH